MITYITGSAGNTLLGFTAGRNAGPRERWQNFRMLDLHLVSTYRYEWNVSQNLTDIGTRSLRFLLNSDCLPCTRNPYSALFFSSTLAL